MILKVRLVKKTWRIEAKETIYIPTWKIISLTATPHYLYITYDELDTHEEVGSYHKNVAIHLNFNDKLDEEKALEITEAFAEEIIAMIKDRSVRIVDVDEIKKKYEVVMK